MLAKLLEDVMAKTALGVQDGLLLVTSESGSPAGPKATVGLTEVTKGMLGLVPLLHNGLLLSVSLVWKGSVECVDEVVPFLSILVHLVVEQRLHLKPLAHDPPLVLQAILPLARRCGAGGCDSNRSNVVDSGALHADGQNGREKLGALLICVLMNLTAINWSTGSQMVERTQKKSARNNVSFVPETIVAKIKFVLAIMPVDPPLRIRTTFPDSLYH
jgi:hypothetical protein